LCFSRDEFKRGFASFEEDIDMIRSFVKAALQEDIGRGDLFFLVTDNRYVDAKIIAKEDGILAGVTYAKVLCKMEKISATFLKRDGDKLKRGDTIATLSGKAKKVLMCERVILNMLQHASGIATNVYDYIKHIKGCDVKLLDTRKTRPHLRVFEKYAVRCGGGSNHRMGLDDCLMIKDTHLGAISDLDLFIKIARKKLPYTSKIEVECESFDSCKIAMKAGSDMIMCDNMPLEEITKVVEYKNRKYPHVLIEASGNITKENIKEFAKSGVDAISSGSLIHQATWLDFSMRVDS
jgi:nicotinate-nucleotide pyrophosphorylase (carboxylating)